MRKALTAIGALLVAACGPDLADNGSVRCEETFECGPDAYCYRGFCVPEPSAPQGTGTVEVDPVSGDSDAGQALAESDAASLPAGDASSPSLPPEPSEQDASTSQLVTPLAPSTPATPTPSTPVTPTPSAPAPTPTTPAATPATPATPAAPDAGAPAGACSLKSCCEEAKKAQEERKKHENEAGWMQKPGKCGCTAPDLLNTLTCGLGSLTGLT